MGSAIGSVAGGVASLFGGKARRAEEANAQAQFTQRQEERDNFEFKNQYENLENTADDLTVNQQASNFQAQQTDSALAGGLDAITASGGGGGGAQAIANAALQSKQGISADIAGQEQSNNSLRAQQAQANQSAEAQGAAEVQNSEYSRTNAQLGESSDRLSAAKAARAQATKDLVGGIAGAASLVGGGLTGGGSFGENLATNFGGADPGTGGGTFDASSGEGSYGSYKKQGGTQSRGDFKSLFR